MRAILQYRTLMIVVPENVECQYCSNNVDRRGHHHLICSGTDCLYHSRHKLLVEAFDSVARVGSFNPVMNAKVTCLGTSGSGGVHHFRPADILIAGDNSSQVAVDVTVTDSDANEAARNKVLKHEESCVAAGYEFAPFAMDTRGLLDQAGVYLLQRIASAYGQNQGKSYSESISIIRKRISCALFKGIAQQLQRARSGLVLEEDIVEFL